MVSLGFSAAAAWRAKGGETGDSEAGSLERTGRMRRHERERGRSARPLAIASSAASDCRGGRSIGTPCRPCCWSHGRGARRRGAAGWCARWSSARLALARTRRWAAAAQIMPLSIAVRAAPCCLHARARGAALWLPRRRFTGCPRPPPYPPPPSPPAYLSRPSCRAPCHWPTSLGRPKQQPHDPPLPHPNAAPLWPTL